MNKNMKFGAAIINDITCSKIKPMGITGSISISDENYDEEFFTSLHKSFRDQIKTILGTLDNIFKQFHIEPKLNFDSFSRSATPKQKICKKYIKTMLDSVEKIFTLLAITDEITNKLYISDETIPCINEHLKMEHVVTSADKGCGKVIFETNSNVPKEGLYGYYSSLAKSSQQSKYNTPPELSLRDVIRVVGTFIQDIEKGISKFKVKPCSVCSSDTLCDIHKKRVAMNIKLINNKLEIISIRFYILNSILFSAKYGNETQRKWIITTYVVSELINVLILLQFIEPIIAEVKHNYTIEKSWICNAKHINAVNNEIILYAKKCVIICNYILKNNWDHSTI